MGKTISHTNISIVERLTLTIGFLILSLIMTKNLPAFALMLCLVFCLKSEGVTWTSIFHFLRIPIVFAFLGLLSIILVIGNDTAHTLLVISRGYIPLSITSESLSKANIVLWRSLNGLLSLYFIISTTSVNEKMSLVTRLRIPQALVELGILAFRYIQLLENKRQNIIVAQRLRLGYSSYRRSFRSSVLLLSTVFIYSIHALRANYQALLIRGYTGRLFYHDATSLQKDRWWFLCIVLLVVTAIIFIYQTYMQ